MEYYTECRIREVTLEKDGKIVVKVAPTEEFSFEEKQLGKKYLLFVEDANVEDAKPVGKKDSLKVLLLSLDTEFCLPKRCWLQLILWPTLKQATLRIKVKEENVSEVVSMTIL